MRALGVVLCVIGALGLIFGVSFLITMRLPYYRDRVRQQGNPEKAKANSTRLMISGVLVLVAGIIIAAVAA